MREEKKEALREEGGKGRRPLEVKGKGQRPKARKVEEKKEGSEASLSTYTYMYRVLST